MISLTALATIAAALALGSGVAWGASSTTVTYSGSPQSGGQISVEAASGAFNRIGAVVVGAGPAAGPHIVIRDVGAGIATGDSPHCGQASPTEVRCDATNLERLVVGTGDLGDHVGFDSCCTKLKDVTIGQIAIDGGSGNDRFELDSSGQQHASPESGDGKLLGNVLSVLGQNGDDRFELSGPGRLVGGTGHDLLFGRAGPQHILGGQDNDRIGCGKGRDVARGGPGKDVGGAGCEQRFSMADGSVRF